MGDILVIISPAYVFGFVLSSVYGLGFFLVFGRGWKQLVLMWVAAVAGFFLGQAVAQTLGLGLFNIGATSVVEGSLVSMLGLIAIQARIRK